MPFVVTAWLRLLDLTPGDFRWGGFLTLHLALVFFALKAIRCRWLQLNHDRRSLLLITVALLIMHGHVLLPGPTLGPADLSVAGTLMLLGGLTPIQRLLARHLEDRTATRPARPATLWLSELSVRLRTGLAGNPHSGRAPPVPSQ
jgi:hypothetical protein